MAGAAELYVGLMSGTSADGVDAVLADFASGRMRIAGAVHLPFAHELRERILQLNQPGADELDRAARLANELARCYADAVDTLLRASGSAAREVAAVGCHGQTVRHRPERGYTVQLGNAALLAELCGIKVVADFRSRDVAAGGQGAPLVPAFHAGVFASPAENRAVLNLGGIANLTGLPREGPITGFDSGPGNCLLDLWASLHLARPMDDNGSWAAGGSPDSALLDRLLEEPFFSASPPKSTGRDRFNLAWLEARGARLPAAQAVQATLLELTARTVVQACTRFVGPIGRLIACGGGTRNAALMQRLAQLFAGTPVETSDRHGIDPQWVEAAAFAWLARQALEGRNCDLRAVTGARGARILGAIYPGS